MNTTPTNPAPRKRWVTRIVATAGGAALVGGAVFGVTAASAASPNPAPSAGSSPASTAPAHRHGRAHFAGTLRSELRIDIRATSGFGDRAHEVAYVLIHHPKAFAKLPAALQSDLKSLEAAALADRDADATKIKDTALGGGYGATIQAEAKAIAARAAAAPAGS
ncbi:hypothetical protein [Specibacter cremeus]|uniref:hypothetical protein n=1 Tax=Specibacter cremeus TaxID=1629051 RepID=UPI000F7A5779|nr:hypothetical protein [Specibacter cremeus]